MMWRLVNKLNEKDMKNEELKMQAEFFQWHWNSFPEERGMLHANNNNSENRIKGALNMAIGVVPGVSDMEYMTRGTVVFIEWKTLTGVQSDAQKKFQAQVEAQGFEYVIFRNVEQAKNFVYERRSRKQA